MQNLVVVSHTVRKHVKGPEIWDTLPPTFYHSRSKFLRSRSNRLGLRGIPKFQDTGAPSLGIWE